MATDPVTGTLGIGVMLKQGVSFDAAFSYQGNLGFQPHFGITYTIKKKKVIPKTNETQAPTATRAPTIISPANEPAKPQ